MTAEIRMPERELRDLRGRGPAGPPPLPQQGMGGPARRWPARPSVARRWAARRWPARPAATCTGSTRSAAASRCAGSAAGTTRTRSTGFFDSLLGGMQGRNPMPVNPKDLDTLRFGLVPGGYFEAEVDAALKDVQDILFGR